MFVFYSTREMNNIKWKGTLMQLQQKKIDKVNIHRLSQAKNYFSFSKCFASQSASLPQDSAAGFHTNRILFIYNIGLIHVFSVVNIRRGPKNVVFFFQYRMDFL